METSDPNLSASLNNLGLQSVEELTQFTSSITPQENLTQSNTVDEAEEVDGFDSNDSTDFQIYRDIPVPNKVYFRIGEVAKLLDLKTYVLRFWENEFTSIKPLKSTSGQRVYKKKHVLQLIEIKRLLYTEKYAISGARKALAQRMRDIPELRGENKSTETEGLAPNDVQMWSQELIYPPPTPVSNEEQILTAEMKAELIKLRGENDLLKKEQQQIVAEYHKREIELKEQVLMIKARLLALKEKLDPGLTVTV